MWTSTARLTGFQSGQRNAKGNLDRLGSLKGDMEETTMTNTELFEATLSANREYVNLVDFGGSAEQQNKAFAKFAKMFGVIITKNLCTEYRDYCDAKTAKGGRVF